MPGLYLVLMPDLTIAAVTDAYLEATMTRREEILGRGIFDVFPDNPEDKEATGVRNLRASLERVLSLGVADAMAVQKYDIHRPKEQGGGFEERFWSPSNHPVIGPEEKVAYIIHRAEDVTDFMRLKSQRVEQDKLAEELRARGDRMESDIYLRAQQIQEANQRLRGMNEELAAANRELQAAHQQADRIFSALAKALPGTILDGKYRLEEELGSGGFGAVFRGKHLALDCPIAIKVFRPVAGNDSTHALERFKLEGRAASCIDHPNAVRVLDSGVSSEGVAYLIMELLRGRSLFAELAAIGTLPLRRAATIAARVADVLATSHRQGLLHRDIKPDNIFLHCSDAGEVVKVVDFGIAKFFGGNHDTLARNLTHAGEHLGTPSFVAPERIRNQPDDGRSDVFSLGAALYEMICGVSPWTRKQLYAMAAGEGVEERPRPMSNFRRGVPTPLEVLVEQSLSWKPTDRPTAAEFAVELDHLTHSLDDTQPEMKVSAPVKN